MDITTATDFARGFKRGVLATLKRDGRPQLSNVSISFTTEGVARISVTADRAKYLNLRRDPRASLHVTSADYGGYVVLEAEADLSPIAASPHDATVEELIEMYRAVMGEHPDWQEYRETMVRDRRLAIRLRPTYAYGRI